MRRVVQACLETQRRGKSGSEKCLRILKTAAVILPVVETKIEIKVIGEANLRGRIQRKCGQKSQKRKNFLYHIIYIAIRHYVYSIRRHKNSFSPTISQI